MEILGRIGTPATGALPAMRSMLKDPRETVRVAAILAIQKLDPGDKSFRAALLQMIHGDDGRVREMAARGLGGIGDSAPESVPALMKCLDDADTHVRRAAVVALGSLGSAAKPAATTLVRRLRITSRPTPKLTLRRARQASRRPVKPDSRQAISGLNWKSTQPLAKMRGSCRLERIRSAFKRGNMRPVSSRPNERTALWSQILCCPIRNMPNAISRRP